MQQLIKIAGQKIVTLLQATDDGNQVYLNLMISHRMMVSLYTYALFILKMRTTYYSALVTMRLKDGNSVFMMFQLVDFLSNTLF